jgi:SAM-dependent methyltransferase
MRGQREVATFDAYAEDYERALHRGVGLSGEDSAFFAERRVAWVGRRLRELGRPVRDVLDFGCGTGSTAPHLLALPGTAHLLGVDVSPRLIEAARRDFGSEAAEFAPLGEPRESSVDLAYCNGVFHHIPPEERSAALRYVWRAVRPEGLFAFWENNPWNPGTRLVMRRIPFDREAMTLSAPEAGRLLRAAGFRVVKTDFMFVFPRALAALRGLEPALARLPLGAQYMVLAAKPNE